MIAVNATAVVMGVVVVVVVGILVVHLLFCKVSSLHDKDDVARFWLQKSYLRLAYTIMRVEFLILCDLKEFLAEFLWPKHQQRELFEVFVPKLSRRLNVFSWSVIF